MCEAFTTSSRLERFFIGITAIATVLAAFAAFESYKTAKTAAHAAKKSAATAQESLKVGRGQWAKEMAFKTIGEIPQTQPFIDELCIPAFANLKPYQMCEVHKRKQIALSSCQADKIRQCISDLDVSQDNLFVKGGKPIAQGSDKPDQCTPLDGNRRDTSPTDEILTSEGEAQFTYRVNWWLGLHERVALLFLKADLDDKSKALLKEHFYPDICNCDYDQFFLNRVAAADPRTKEDISSTSDLLCELIKSPFCGGTCFNIPKSPVSPDRACGP